MNAHRDLGAWVVAVYKVLSQYNIDEPALDPLEGVIKAGRAGELFSAIRAAGTIQGPRYETHRKLARLRPTDAKRIVELAARLGYVDIAWASDDSQTVQRIEFKIDSNDSVLEAVGEIFGELEPTPVARCVITILQVTLPLPQTREAIANELKGFSETTITEALDLAVALGLASVTEETQSGSPLVFNPHIFESDDVDVLGTLNSLNSVDRQRAQDIVDHVYNSPGVPLPSTTDKRILQLLVRLGVVDFSKITTAKSQSGVYFPTAPKAWGVLAKTGGPELSQDLIDDSKLFINSLRYGERFSTTGRGKIHSPYLIVNALLRDGAIGVQKPATAIGEDYPLAWSRGIINVVESRVHPGRYSMELLKRDVASAVKDVLTTQKILPSPATPSADEIERAGQFISPGAVRVEKALPTELKRYHDELVYGLRIMRTRR